MCPQHRGRWEAGGSRWRVSTGRAWGSQRGWGPGAVRLCGLAPGLTSGLSRVETPRTCAGQGHPPVLLLVRGALVGARGRYGEGGGCRQGASVIVQLATGGHDDPVIVGEERELWRGRSHTQPFLSQPRAARKPGLQTGQAVPLAGLSPAPARHPQGGLGRESPGLPPAPEERLQPALMRPVTSQAQPGTGRLEDRTAVIFSPLPSMRNELVTCDGQAGSRAWRGTQPCTPSPALLAVGPWVGSGA